MTLTHAAGREAGAAYAETAPLAELDRLGAFRESAGRDWERLIYDGGSAHSAAEKIYFAVEPDSAGGVTGRKAAEEWWEAACWQCDVGSWHDPDFVAGFVDAALEAADEADRVRAASDAEGSVSAHEVRLVAALQERPEEWRGNDDLAAAAAISSRTARAHLPRLIALGVAEGLRLHPARKYRLVAKPGPTAARYLDRVRKAAGAFAS
jgi:hypothetical protein